VTHFFASLGTCGTITGAGGFLKQASLGKVKVHGVHPTSVHDIPGVRSLPQLPLTDHFKPKDYDELTEVTNEDAFDMCVRLNQEESLIAGPSSGMNVVGALRLMPDEPGNVGVVIMCDDVFKYTASATKHCPRIFDKPKVSFEPAELSALETVLTAGREGPDTLDMEALEKLKAQLAQGGGRSPTIIDVRPKDEFESRLRARGAINIPLPELLGTDESSEVVQVMNVPGAVQRKKADADDDRPKKRPKTAITDALSKAVSDFSADTPLLLVCNRGVDSLFGMLALRGAGFSVQQVARGMFAWHESGLPTEENDKLVDLPPPNNKAEEAVLERLGYDLNGKAKLEKKTACSTRPSKK